MAGPVTDDPRARVEELRASIRDLDEDLVATIAARSRLAREIGRAKIAAGLPIVDPEREAEVVRHAAALARESELDEEGVRRVFWDLIALCRRGQSGG